jgi:hypothetical protein
VPALSHMQLSARNPLPTRMEPLQAAAPSYPQEHVKLHHRNL